MQSAGEGVKAMVKRDLTISISVGECSEGSLRSETSAPWYIPCSPVYTLRPGVRISDPDGSLQWHCGSQRSDSFAPHAATNNSNEPPLQRPHSSHKTSVKQPCSPLPVMPPDGSCPPHPQPFLSATLIVNVYSKFSHGWRLPASTQLTDDTWDLCALHTHISLTSSGSQLSPAWMVKPEMSHICNAQPV